MKKNPFFLWVPILFSILLMGHSCEEEYPTCNGACRHLAFCESEWMVEDGLAPMTEGETTQYEDACNADCDGDQDEIDCLYEATCEDLADGACR